MVNSKPDILYIWFNYLEIIMYIEVWVDKDEILDKLNVDLSEELQEARHDANIALLQELRYVYDMRGKQAMLDKLNFLMSDFKLQEMDL